MAYTAFEKMRRRNRKRFGMDVGPVQPVLYTNRRSRNDLKSAALRFLHNRCEGLRFDPVIEKEERDTGVFQGKSLKANQIPYNMQMDINRLCLEKTLENFIDSGAAEDACEVYYCYLEIFLGQYSRSKKMADLLSEYEQNGSSLLMKHRDHYSHSVYVFALGLAIYETNGEYRRAFRQFYEKYPEVAGQGGEAFFANLFLEFWGLTALFHDIGYPFELPFEQLLSYYEVEGEGHERGEGSLYMAYRDVSNVTTLSDAAKAHFKSLYGKTFETVVDLIAENITDKLGAAYGFTGEYMRDVLNRKPVAPQTFGYYMDHAYFSAVRLYRELSEEVGTDRIGRCHVDSLSAIMLHNSLFKFSISYYKDPDKRRSPLDMNLHPLAWMLMLCDELQCWDRTAYGRNSRTELHPMAAEFDFTGGAVSGIYYYDLAEQDKIEAFEKAYADWEKNPEGKKEPRLKAYSDMAGTKQKFTADIEKIVNTEHCPLKILPSMRKPDRGSKRSFLSNTNFLHLHDFAVALHARNMEPGTEPAEMEKKFSSLSLEYQLATINRAKYFAEYLDAIGCFYTDRPVDYEMVTRFGPRDAAVFAPMEHERWIREHQAMGWRYGTAYQEVSTGVPKEQERNERAALREQMRCHKLMMDGRLTSEQIRLHYLDLSKADRDKDWRPFNTLLKLLKKFDGLRIYRLS